MIRCFVIASLLLAGCSTTPPLTDSDCLARGRERVAYTHFLHVCQWPALDAGKRCHDSRECQGTCELPESFYKTVPTSGNSVANAQPVRLLVLPKAGTSVVGVCSTMQSEIKTPNCREYVSDGRVAFPHCLD
jgi:hypothetical protein